MKEEIPIFDFRSIYEARSVGDAVSALSAAPEAVLIAGGTDVLIRLRSGALAGCALVSIHGLPELHGVSMDGNGTIHIGPLTTFRDIQHDSIIRTHIPLLGRAVGTIGSPQIRAVGTIGGNVSNGYTTADSPPSLLALNARVTVTGQDGPREMPISDYYLAPEKMNLRPGELLTDIAVRREDYEGYAGHYIKYSIRNAMDIAILGCCANVRLSPDKKTLEDIRLSFGVAGPLPLRAYQTENALRGMSVGEALLGRVGALAPTQDVAPQSCRRASCDFRRYLIGVLSQDALKTAIQNAGGEFDA